MTEIKKWGEMTIDEQVQWHKEQTAQLDAEKLKLVRTMELDNKNESGIIKVEIRKGDKVSAAEIYVDKYLKLLEIHKGMGDTIIQSVLNELKD